MPACLSRYPSKVELGLVCSLIRLDKDFAIRQAGSRSLAEGEILDITPSQTSPKNTSPIPTTQEQPLEEPRKLRERTTAMNYRKMNNPMSRTPIFHRTTPLQSLIPTIAPISRHQWKLRKQTLIHRR